MRNGAVQKPRGRESWSRPAPSPVLIELETKGICCRATGLQSIVLALRECFCLQAQPSIKYPLHRRRAPVLENEVHVLAEGLGYLAAVESG